jgi:hypothetical protein
MADDDVIFKGCKTITGNKRCCQALKYINIKSVTLCHSLVFEGIFFHVMQTAIMPGVMKNYSILKKRRMLHLDGF